MKRVTIKTQNGNYDALIEKGLLRDTGSLFSERFDPCKIVLVSDDSAERLYAQTVLSSLKEAGYETSCFVFPHGEKSKTMGTLDLLLEFLASEKLARSDMVVSLGGGVCGDISGFAAGIYLRGIRSVQIPTTLLAAVDASVGGKTGVNLSAGKNLAGVFHQPSLVLFDPETLSTLSADSVLDGKAEIVKYGIIAGGAVFDAVKEGIDMGNIEDTAASCIAVKGGFVKEDTFDRGKRQLLNFGHTIGHALEKCSLYKISHGRGVAAGMAAETRAAVRSGFAESGVLRKISDVLKKNGLDFRYSYDVGMLSEALLHDKKISEGKLNIVVPEEIGRCVIRSLKFEELEDYIGAGM